MHKPTAKVWDVPSGLSAALAVTSLCFFLGGCLGCLLAVRVGGGGNDLLAEYLTSFLQSVQAQPASPPLLLLVWETVRWPLLVFGLGFTMLGLLAIPLVFSVRGFLLAFSIASFVKMFGAAGALLAFVVFGVSGCIALPALFVLGVQSWTASRCLATRMLGDGRRSLPYGKLYFLRCGMCACALCVCVFLESVVVPSLLAGAAGMFPL